MVLLIGVEVFGDMIACDGLYGITYPIRVRTKFSAPPATTIEDDQV